MCERLALFMSGEKLLCASSYRPVTKYVFLPELLQDDDIGKTFTPSYNITPSDVTPVIASCKRFEDSMQYGRVMKNMIWGLIPPWHTGEYRMMKFSTHNCRIEDIKDSKLYGPLLREGGRCVVVVEGYYEWQTKETDSEASKQPYFIHKKQLKEKNKMYLPDYITSYFEPVKGWVGMRLLFLAGLYSIWEKNDGSKVHSYSIITMESSESLKWLHDRMPAVLDTEQQIKAWLDIDKVGPDVALSHLTPSTELTWYPVTTTVNNTKDKSVDCIIPLGIDKDSIVNIDFNTLQPVNRKSVSKKSTRGDSGSALKKEDNDKVTKKEDNDKVTKKEDNDKVTKKEDNDKVTKKEDKDTVTKKEVKNTVTKKEVKNTVTKKGDNDSVSQKGDSDSASQNEYNNPESQKGDNDPVSQKGVDSRSNKRNDSGSNKRAKVSVPIKKTKK